MDVIERVHEEMRIDLVAERFQLVPQVLRLQFLHPTLAADRLQVIFRTQVHAQHKQAHDHLHHFRGQRQALACGRRRPSRHPPEHPHIGPEQDHQDQEDSEVDQGLPFLHQQRGDQQIVQEEQHEKGKDSQPDAQDVPNLEFQPRGMPLEKRDYGHQGQDAQPEDAVDDNLLHLFCEHPYHTCRKITKHFRQPHPVR